MSWFKAVAYSDDVFDENADELVLINKEWTSNMKKRIRDGFVDGADFAEDAALTPGFNLGFREGAALTVAVGRLKGIVSAIWCWYQIHHPESPLPASVTDLLQRVSKHEDGIRDRIKYAFENPPASVSSVSESMEDLEVKQGGPGCCGGEGCGGEGCGKGGCGGEGCGGEGCGKGGCGGEGCGKGGCGGEGCGGEGCGGEGCGKGGCKEKDCCKKGEKMDVDIPHHQHKLSPESSDSAESLDQLLQHCMDVVSELGLPQELKSHIQELKNM